MADITTIPKKHYVTIQYRKDASTESGLLGFASPYTKDAAFEKRKATQDSWAYHGSAKVNIDPEDDNITCTQLGDPTKGGYNCSDVSTLFITKCYPIITDNELLEGFEVAKSVKRCGWNGGNVVWRIADPRGFELEISSANFARVLDCTTIINGVIQGKCLWGRNGAANILLPEMSDVYQDAVKLTTAIEKKVSLKDVKVGDTIDILVQKQVKTVQYLGKYWFLLVEYGSITNERYGNTYDSGKRSFNESQIERYLTKDADGNYSVYSSLKVIDITKPIDVELDRTQVAKEISTSLSAKSSFKGIYESVVLISPSKIKASQITTELVPIDEKISGNWGCARYSSTADSMIVAYDGEWWVSTFKRNGYDDQTSTLTAVDISDLPNGSVKFDTNLVSSDNRFYGHGYRTDHRVIDAFDWDKIECYRIVVSCSDIKGKVFKL